MNRNDSPRLINKLYEIIKEIFSGKNLLEKYTQEFKESLISEDEHYSINYYLFDTKYYFRGYPNGNLLKIFAKILDLWHNLNFFPINFHKIEGLKDLTNNVVEFLNTHTSNINLAFTLLKDNNSQGACKILINFLDCIGMRGFLTAIGVRVTPGSCENVLPKREELFKYFNIVYQPFWGTVSGSELDRNEKANEILKKLFDECVWVNMHMLPHSAKTLEIRNQNGHGIRWFLNGEFRGFIEPEDVFDKVKEKSKKNLKHL